MNYLHTRLRTKKEKIKFIKDYMNPLVNFFGYKLKITDAGLEGAACYDFKKLITIDIHRSSIISRTRYGIIVAIFHELGHVVYDYSKHSKLEFYIELSRQLDLWDMMATLCIKEEWFTDEYGEYLMGVFFPDLSYSPGYPKIKKKEHIKFLKEYYYKLDKNDKR